MKKVRDVVKGGMLVDTTNSPLTFAGTPGLESDYDSATFRATSKRMLPRVLESIRSFPLQKPARMSSPQNGDEPYDEKAVGEAFDRRVDADISQAGEVGKMMRATLTKKFPRMKGPSRKK